MILVFKKIIKQGKYSKEAMHVYNKYYKLGRTNNFVVLTFNIIIIEFKNFYHFLFKSLNFFQ